MTDDRVTELHSDTLRPIKKISKPLNKKQYRYSEWTSKMEQNDIIKIGGQKTLNFAIINAR